MKRIGRGSSCHKSRKNGSVSIGRRYGSRPKGLTGSMMPAIDTSCIERTLTVANHQASTGRIDPVSKPGIVRDEGTLANSVEETAVPAVSANERAGRSRGTVERRRG